MSEAETRETTLRITHPSGLHLRPLALFIKTASRFKSTVTARNLSRDGSPEVDAKSMTGVMRAGVSQGHELWVRATGPDAGEAIAALERLVRSDFEDSR